MDTDADGSGAAASSTTPTRYAAMTTRSSATNSNSNPGLATRPSRRTRASKQAPSPSSAPATSAAAASTLAKSAPAHPRNARPNASASLIDNDDDVDMVDAEPPRKCRTHSRRRRGRFKEPAPTHPAVDPPATGPLSAPAASSSLDSNHHFPARHRQSRRKRGKQADPDFPPNPFVSNLDRQMDICLENTKTSPHEDIETPTVQTDLESGSTADAVSSNQDEKENDDDDDDDDEEHQINEDDDDNNDDDDEDVEEIDDDDDDDMDLARNMAESLYAAASPGGINLEALLRSNVIGASSSFGISGGGGSGGGSSNPMTNRIRGLVAAVKTPGDANGRLIALQGLSEILSIASEDMFSNTGGSRAVFNTRELTAALIGVFDTSDAALAAAAAFDTADMYDADTGFGGTDTNLLGSLPDLMLLSCRCLSNLIEANPSSISTIVQQHGVENLVAKLLEIEYIDLAEQIMSVLERISIEYPSAILHANGLVAVLQYIDFFSTHVQRSAMTTAANACRGLVGYHPTRPSNTRTPNDVLDAVLAVMDVITRTISSADKKLAEQAVRCLSLIVDWAARDSAKVDRVATPIVLNAVIVALGSMTDRRIAQENSVVFVSLLRILSSLGKSSIQSAKSLVLRFGVLGIIRNILTGGLVTEDDRLMDTTDNDARAELHAATSAALINSIVSRSTDQLIDILNVPALMLPPLPPTLPWHIPTSARSTAWTSSADTTDEIGTLRVKNDATSAEPDPEMVAVFVRTLLPLLFDVFGATVSLAIRRKVVKCVAQCIWFCKDAALLNQTLHACRGFGKFVFELVNLHEVALPEGTFGSLTPAMETLVDAAGDAAVFVGIPNTIGHASSGEPIPTPTSSIVTLTQKRHTCNNDVKEALLLMIAGLQITMVAVDKCEPLLKVWLSREGVLAEIRKIHARYLYAEKYNADVFSPSSSSAATQSTFASSSSTGLSNASDSSQTPDSSIAPGRLSLAELPARIGAQDRSISNETTLDPTTTDATELELAQLSDGLRLEDVLREFEQTRRTPSAMASVSSSSSSGRDPMDRLDRISALVNLLRARAESTSMLSSSPTPQHSSSTPSDQQSKLTSHVPSYQLLTGLDGERFSEADAYRWIIENAASILDEESATSSNDMVDTGVLSRLSALATRLHTPASNEASLDVQVKTTLTCLHELAQHFTGSQQVDDHHGLTGFELATSGLIDILVDFMSTPGANDTHKVFVTAPVPTSRWILPLALRLRCFAHVFLGAPAPHELINASQRHDIHSMDGSYFVPGAFRLVVVRLEELVSRSERVCVRNAMSPIGTVTSSVTPASRLPLSTQSMLSTPSQSSNPASAIDNASSIGSSYRDNAAPSLQLTRQIRIRLVSDTSTSPATHSDQLNGMVVSIHAVASLRALENYLVSRIDPMHKVSGSSSSSTVLPHRRLGTADTRTSAISAAASEASSTLSPSSKTTSLVDPSNESSDDAGASSNNDMRVDNDTALDSRHPESSMTEAASSSTAEFGSPSHASPVGDSAKDSKLTQGTSYSAAASAGAAATRLSIEFSVGGETVSNDVTVFNVLYRLLERQQQSQGLPVASDTTIIGVTSASDRRKKAVPVTSHAATPVDIWHQTHSITFKVIRGAPTTNQAKPDIHGQPDLTPNDASSPIKPDRASSISTLRQCACNVCAFTPSLAFPNSDAFQPLALHALYLLRILHGLNRHARQLFAADLTSVKQHQTTPLHSVAPVTAAEASSLSLPGALPESDFYNNKLAAKLTRQLDEPLIVVSDVLPEWCRLLVEHFAFLLPLDLRVSYLQATAFGYARSLLHWQQQQQQQQQQASQRIGGMGTTGRMASNHAGGGGTASGSDSPGRSSLPFGRIPRRKVRVSRTNILESMFKTMLGYSSSTAALEFEFFDEVGTGLGPTLEFYALISRDLRIKEGVVWPSNLVVKSVDDAVKDAMNGIACGDLDNPGTDNVRLTVWRTSDTSTGPYMDPAGGLYPASFARSDKFTARALASLFFCIGAFVAKALMDSRVLDLRLSPLFLEQVLDKAFCYGEDASLMMDHDGDKADLPAEFSLLQSLDPVLARSLQTLVRFLEAKRVAEKDSERLIGSGLDQITVDGATISDMSLDMTLPSRPDVELVPGGVNISVTLTNLKQYMFSVVDQVVARGVRLQIRSFRQGFDSVLGIDKFRCLSGEELAMLICGGADDSAAAASDWGLASLRECIRSDHGYHTDSRIILQLTQMLTEYSVEDRRRFLRFVTGSPKLPFGGFKALSPPLTVVRKVPESGYRADDYLPSVMTCANYLKVPEYSSSTVMVQRFALAMREGQGSFHLS